MRKLVSVIISSLLVLNILPVFVQANTDNSVVRIALTYYDGANKLNVKVAGNYSIVHNNGINLVNGQVYSIEASENRLIVKSGTTVLGDFSNQVRFVEHSGSTLNYLQINNGRSYKGNMEFRIKANTILSINELFIEDYLKGVVPSEMPNSWPLEALKAQAVAARTYAVKNYNKYKSQGFCLTDSQGCQVYRGYLTSGVNQTNQAVEQTVGEVVRYNGTLISTYYSSSNGGYTEAIQSVWGGNPVAYLIQKEDPYDLKSSQDNTWPKYINKAQIKQRLASEGIDLGDILSLSYTLHRQGDPKNRASAVTIEGTKGKSTINKTTAYRILFPGDTRLLWYSIEEDENGYVFNWKGWGHGVGMSQHGAMQMGKIGKTYVEILGFYYTDTQVNQMQFTRPVLTPMPTQPEPPSTPQPPPSQADPPQPSPEPIGFGKVSVGALNVRDGAGPQYKIIGKLAKDTQIEILSIQGDWYRVKTDKLTGYVYGEYIDIKNGGDTSKPPDNGQDKDNKNPPEVSLPPERQYGRVTASTLNVRAEASTRAKIVGRLPKGTEVEIIGNNNGWYRIKSGNMSGFVHGDYIEKVNKSANPVPQVQYGVVIVGTLNVRQTASTNAAILGRITKGTNVELLSSDKGWYRIKAGNITGFVYGEYIEKINKPVSPPQNENQYGIVTNTLNVRTDAGTGFPIIKKLPKNTEIKIISAHASWYKIEHQGTVGFVHGDFISIKTGTTSRGDNTQRTGKVTVSVLNLRSGPGTNNKIIGRLNLGTTVQILGQTNGWYHIRVPSGNTGYVHGDYVK